MTRSEAKHNRLIPPPKRVLLSGPVDGLPLVSGSPLPVSAGHPVPVASGEVSKFRRVKERCSDRDSESDQGTSGWGVTITDGEQFHGLTGPRLEPGSVRPVDDPVGGLLEPVLELCIKVLGPSEPVAGLLLGSNPDEDASARLADHKAETCVRLLAAAQRLQSLTDGKLVERASTHKAGSSEKV